MGYTGNRNNPVSPDDIESSLSIIEANGGLGQWEGDDEDMEIERYSFPRFPGADDLGACKIKSHGSEHTRTDKCKAFTPDPGNMYLSRPGIGSHSSDVETIDAWLDAPRNIVGGVMLLGNPGTGKTALLEAAVTYGQRKLTTVVFTPDHTKDDLLRVFVGEGNGEKGTPYNYGPLAKAAIEGHVFYGDEVMLLMDGVKPILYAAADGRRFLPEGDVDGSPLEINPDFRLVVSSNPMVRGASLPEPLSSRFASTTLTVETSASLLRDLNIDDSIIAAWETMKTQGLWHPEIRELRLADYWMPIDETQAASALIPEHCPESQRQAVRDIVVGYVGGNLRLDGRLVVA